MKPMVKPRHVRKLTGERLYIKDIYRESKGFFICRGIKGKKKGKGVILMCSWRKGRLKDCLERAGGVEEGQA